METNNQSITTVDPLRGRIAARHILERATENLIQPRLRRERPTGSVVLSTVQGLMEHFRWTMLKECLDVSDNLVSDCQHVFATGVVVVFSPD